jgi:hypothetical protein
MCCRKRRLNERFMQATEATKLVCILDLQNGVAVLSLVFARRRLPVEDLRYLIEPSVS